MQVLYFWRRHRRLVTALRVFWALLLGYGEIGVFYRHIGQCAWPALPTRIAIIADPQIVDHHSYGQTGLALRLTEFFTDIYVRKSYMILQQLQGPDHVVILGDLMDGGREWDDIQWLDELHRFQTLFRNRDPRNRRVHIMAGNHDIGIGNTVVDAALARFRLHVGATNQLLDVAGHRLVLLDTLTLESDSAHVNASSRALVERLRGEREPRAPRVLFSHVPLRRPPHTDCGPLRQSPEPVPDRRGYQFRDQLQANTTAYVLNAIMPQVVFSGDDHDTCTVAHTLSNGRSAVEHTIGAFGWASGVPIASYALLALQADPLELALQHCFLPYQLGIYKCYAAAFVCSLLVAAACCRRRSEDCCGAEPGLIAALPPRKPQAAGPHCIKRVALVMRDVAAVAVPTYIACILYFYIV